MDQSQVIKSLIIIPIIAALIAWGGSHLSQICCGVPIFALCVAMAFAINWLAFIPAYSLQTEKFYDLVGSLTYITVTSFALYCAQELDIRSKILAGLVAIWAIRLGSFLAKRIYQDGKDDRFDTIKPNFLRFLNAWTIQALWVTLTSAAAIIAITSSNRVEPDYFLYIGVVIWLIGFTLEVVADYQKRQFKKDATNKGKFIQSGLWSKSQHPNYFGEIMLWTGIFIIAIPVLQGGQWVAILSPLFVYLLLTRVSGIPMLRAKAENKWGGQEDYEKYKRETPILVPKL